MFANIITGAASGAGANTYSGRVTAFDADGLLFRIVVGGSGHLVADWDAHIVTVTLRGEKDRVLVNSVRMGDIFKVSDHYGGFSESQEGADGTAYQAYLPLGNVILRGDDTLEVTYYVPGDASATYTPSVWAIDQVQMGETLIAWETITGNGSDQVFSDCLSVYYMTAASGENLAVQDDERSYIVSDYGVQSLGLALGQLEVLETEWGLLYQDRHGFGQTVRVKLPSNSKALVKRIFYAEERVARSEQAADTLRARLVEQIVAENPTKAAILRIRGLIA